MQPNTVFTKLSKYYLILDTKTINNTIYINLVTNTKTDYYRAVYIVKYEFQIKQIKGKYPKVCFKVNGFDVVLEFVDKAK